MKWAAAGNGRETIEAASSRASLTNQKFCHLHLWYELRRKLQDSGRLPKTIQSFTFTWEANAFVWNLVQSLSFEDCLIRRDLLKAVVDLSVCLRIFWSSNDMGKPNIDPHGGKTSRFVLGARIRILHRSFLLHVRQTVTIFLDKPDRQYRRRLWFCMA